MQIGKSVKTILVEPLELPVAEPQASRSRSMTQSLHPHRSLNENQSNRDRPRLHLACRRVPSVAVGRCWAQVVEWQTVAARHTFFGCL